MQKRVGMFLLLISCTAGIIIAQPNRKGIEWMLKEKIKINPEMAVKQMILENPDLKPGTDGGKGTLQYTDNPIVSSSNIDAEVHAAVNPVDSQNILASPIRQSGMSLNTPIYYTKNFGGVWTKSPFNPMPSSTGAYPIGGGDPVLAFDADGKAYFSWLELHLKNMSSDTIFWGLYWAYSEDGGASWTRPQNNVLSYSKVSTASNTADRPISDKQWMSVDRTSGTYRNNLYVSFVEIDLTTGFYQILVHTKPADSTIFNPAPVKVTDSTFTLCQFASLDVDYAGHVHVCFFGTKNNIQYGLYHSKSTDGGASFSTPVLITQIQMPRFSAGQTNGTVPGISNDRLYPSCYLSANRVSQHIYATWTANGITQKLNNGLDIYFSSSDDGGATWSAPKVVNDDLGNIGAHQYYSSINCGPEGNVIMGWYDRRDDTANLVAHYYFTESFDHGATFAPSYQVTTSGTDFTKVGASNSDFGIGEYTQILGLKDHIIPVWTDGRTNNGNLNIYVAFINRKTMSLEQFTGVNRNLGIQKLYPNPASDHINLDYTLEQPSSLELYLFDSTGKKIYEQTTGKQAGKGTCKIPLRDYPDGIYYVMVKTGMETFSRKLVVRK